MMAANLERIILVATFTFRCYIALNGAAPRLISQGPGDLSPEISATLASIAELRQDCKCAFQEG